MISVFLWYLLITILGWMTFPLTYSLFTKLTDRGYTLARIFGLMLWGYVFWLSASLGIVKNDVGGLSLYLIVAGGLGIWRLISHNGEILEWINENRRLIITTEFLFLISFALFSFFRSANPDITGTEKPMELMLINGIINSPTFPPRDLWLSGYSISYYYFGYVMTAMLAKFTGTPATVAFNLMLSLIFSLSAIGAYGVLYNFLVIHTLEYPSLNRRKVNITLQALLGPFFLLIISNVEGFLEVLHSQGIFWQQGVNFWTWLDIPELKEVPSPSPSLIPQRLGWWWWRASRVIMDYDFNNKWTGDVINEFPAFSFLLGDLHPHVIGIPFFLLSVAIAFNLFLGGFRGEFKLHIMKLHISMIGFLLTAFMVGGIAFLNTWDTLPVVSLLVFSYMLSKETSLRVDNLWNSIFFGFLVLFTAYILYFPFFVGFASQAGGILPNFMYITRGAQLWVIWGTLFIPIFTLLLYFIKIKKSVDWKTAWIATLGLLILLSFSTLVIGFAIYQLRPEIVQQILTSQQLTLGKFILASLNRRLIYFGGFITMLSLLVPALAFLFGYGKTISSKQDQMPLFIYLLIIIGSLLILGPDFLYLKDNFGYRINTIFKFYYQAWIMLSITAAFSMAVLLSYLRGSSRIIFNMISAAVIIVGLTYPILSFPYKANNFKPRFGYSLDDFQRIQRENPDEAAAILWLQKAPDGVIVEATGGPYSNFGRISIYTGLPTVLGWGNHEGQWRGSDFQNILIQRTIDIETLYSTSNWSIAQTILDRYNIHYIVLGQLERNSYKIMEGKFQNHLPIGFQQGNIIIYEVP